MNFIEMLTANVSGQSIGMGEIVFAVFLSFAIGLLIGWVYKFTHSGFGYSQSFVVTLIMMCVVISLVILVVGSNIAGAFSFAGALAVIRFRMSLREPKDIAYVLLATAMGLAVGARAYVLAVVSIVMVGVFVIVLTKLDLFKPGYKVKRLKITIPEDLNYEGVFDEVLERYCVKYSLSKVMNIDLGTLFELVYDVKMREDISEKAFLDEIRTLNGNLKISLTLASDFDE